MPSFDSSVIFLPDFALKAKFVTELSKISQVHGKNLQKKNPFGAPFSFPADGDFFEISVFFADLRGLTSSSVSGIQTNRMVISAGCARNSKNLA